MTETAARIMSREEFTAWRYELRLTQQQYADALMISIRLVQYIEAGDRNLTPRMARDVERLIAERKKESA